MTRNRARKNVARERMATTGEPYTAARRKAGPPENGPYPPGTQWTFHNLRHPSTAFRMPLHYLWEPDGSWITDEYTTEDISARQLWDQWVKQVGARLSAKNDQARPGDVIISWYVTGQGRQHSVFEGPPFELPTLAGHTIPENFLTFFSTPCTPRPASRSTGCACQCSTAAGTSSAVTRAASSRRSSAGSPRCCSRP
ncbi:hypothetical protein [Kitasatospora griseola]|uniref:hypothetical protein n=1 Tax=Kitasatospora griseola TaxID=2064 RepID=UPI0016709435|nr:hypothetical protein [Kitasatospora griseola]GGR01966.1 hypothetical protein GCM10010195_67150 [Kitasatospora griseola]